jgi:KDO2-lipid IV(A) lauroyltransferase
MKAGKVKNRTIEYSQYLAFRLLCFLINLVPLYCMLKIGRFGGRRLYHWLPKFRKVALENLKFAFPEKSEEEIKKIAVQSFENLGLFAVEFIRIPKIKNRFPQYVAAEGDECVYESLKRDQKGVIMIVSHFGNWEWSSVRAGERVRDAGHKISAVARNFGNPFLYQYVIEKMRGVSGMKTVNKKGGAREVMKILERNEIVCVLIDQHERHGSVPVPYFGREAWTTALPAMMALKKDATIVPVFIFRGEDGKPSLMQIRKPFPLIKTGNYEDDLVANTAQYIKAIEDVVRERPGDWLWMHARWRSHRTEKVR